MITNVTQYLDQRKIDSGKKVAISDGEKSLSFEELYDRSQRVAVSIRQKNNNINNRPIIIFGNKGIAEYIAFMGVLYSGNYYVPLDVKMPVPRLEKIVRLLQAEVAIVENEYESRLREAGYEGEVIYLQDDPAIEEQQVLENYRGRVVDTDPAYVLFTSGSTGTPKGVVVSHRAIVDYIEWQCAYLPFDKNTVLGNQAPFYFDASMPDIYTPLCMGVTLYIIPEMLFLVPNKLVDYINQYKINTLIWVPSALMTLTNRNYFEKKKIDDLRLVMFCGEIMPNRHLNIWRKYYTKTEFVNLYGPTEAAYACTYFVVNRPFADNEPLPIGKPCENTDIIVLNENNTRVQQGEEGELCIRGTCLANGYYDNKEKTLQVFTQNPLNSLYEDKIYRTGDIVKYNEFGELEYVGRTDFQIKHLGYRIELGEIETATYGLDGIKQCCAIYQKEADKIVLFCVGDLEQTEKQIYTYLKEHIPRYMLPGKIILLQEMPLNANGKIDRLLLAGKIQL